MRPRHLFILGIGLACYMGWRWYRRNVLDIDLFSDPMDWGEHPV